MIFNYSAEEKKNLAERDNDYAAQLDQIDAEIAQLTKGDLIQRKERRKNANTVHRRRNTKA